MVEEGEADELVEYWIGSSHPTKNLLRRPRILANNNLLLPSLLPCPPRHRRRRRCRCRCGGGGGNTVEQYTAPIIAISINYSP